MKICVKHLVQYQAHSKNSVHYCYFHDHDDQTSWNLLFTSQGPSLLAAVFSFIIISVIVDFFPTKTLVCFETFWLSFSERLSHFCSPYTPYFFLLSYFLHQLFIHLFLHCHPFIFSISIYWNLPRARHCSLPVQTHLLLNPPRHPNWVCSPRRVNITRTASSQITGGLGWWVTWVSGRCWTSADRGQK